MRILFFLLSILITYSNITAQQHRPLSSANIYKKLKQLNKLGTVMYLAAHPDDENTRLIAYLVHNENIKTVYLSLTRGDGGQNILGNEQGSALGLIRSYEMMEARKIDGAEQLFGSNVDFGFSKNPEETFNFWDKEKTINEIINAIQYYKPDLVICRFPPTGEGGHGHHTASAIAALEAYQQLEKRKSENPDVWLPKRLLFNAFQFGNRNTIKDDQLILATNQYDPLLGESYGENAGRSRSMHKSQGAGTPQRVGITNEHFSLMAGEQMEASIFDGIDMSWNRIDQAPIELKLQQIIQSFSFDTPSLIIPELIQLRKEVTKVSDRYWKDRKLKEIDKIIISCAGIMIEALAEVPEIVAKEDLNILLNFISRSKYPVKIVEGTFSRLVKSGRIPPITLNNDSLYSFPITLQLNESEPLTQPYWMKKPPFQNHFHYDSIEAFHPTGMTELYASITIEILGEEFTVKTNLSHKKLDPVRGDVVEQIRVIPAVSITPHQRLFIFEGEQNKTTWVRLKCNQEISNSSLAIYHNNTLIKTTPLPPLNKGTDTLIGIEVPVIKIDTTSDLSYLSFAVFTEVDTFTKGVNLIQYPHIPELQYLTDTWVKTVKKSWDTKVSKIGYISGAGDYIMGVLETMGLNVEEVPLNTLSDPKHLQHYDAIIIGIRAFNVIKELDSKMPTIMKYVENGGNLIVQYNTNSNLLSDKLGPYPISISRSRVTDENAEVRFLDTSSTLLNFPNKIVKSDFKNWVQERGIYYPADWDSRYKTLISMNDNHEPPLEGAILYTPYGKGFYTYTSLAFFRQLPAGNIGAIRLFMNLLSSGKQ